MVGDVWIVGASRGLGLEMAHVFARRGRKVVGLARRRPADLTAFDAFVTLDLHDSDAFDARLHRMFATRAAPELVIYCAAQVYQGPLVHEPHEAMRAELDANFLGFVRLCQAVALFKPPAARVRLVATGSTLGYVGCPSLDTYSASKAALISFARSARRELAAHGVAIQILSPPHMDNGGADLIGPQPFTVAWSAAEFVRAAEGGVPELLLGASNRLMQVMARVSPGLAQSIMDAIGADALKRGASRTPA